MAQRIKGERKMKGEKGEIKKFFSGLLALVVLGGATLGGLELWAGLPRAPTFARKLWSQSRLSLSVFVVFTGARILTFC